MSRRNDRMVSTGRGWVKNGDRWIVVGLPGDGSLVVRRLNGSSTVRLSADYVAEHVELGDATTAHRAQGMTVDTAHVVADTDRAVFPFDPPAGGPPPCSLEEAQAAFSAAHIAFTVTAGNWTVHDGLPTSP